MAMAVERHRLIFCRWLFEVLAARESCNEPTMNAYFKRQLADYVEYHRNPWNGVMHVFGIVFLFLAAILPLSLWPVNAFGAHITVAPIMVLPVLIYWFLLDAALGTAILGAAVMLLSIAAIIVNYASSLQRMVHFDRIDRHRHRISNYRPSIVRTPAAGAHGQSESLAARADVRDGKIIYRARLSA